MTIKYITRLMLASVVCFSSSCSTTQQETIDETQEAQEVRDTTPRVTGIGGIFFRAKSPDSLRNWYGDNLGIAVSPFGSPFEFRNANDPDQVNYAIWNPFPDSTSYFDPSDKEFMINYRVHNIKALVDQLRLNGAVIVDTITEYPYGKFVHVLDPEGNNMELWEPVDSILTGIGEKTTK